MFFCCLFMYRNGTQNVKNGWVDIWFMRFHFRASIKPIFENHIFWPVLPSKKAKKRKWLVFFCLWVYNFEFFFGGSTHLYAPLVNSHKQNSKKSFFRDTLVIRVIRVTSVKSLVGILTHQGHISKVNANA